MHELNPLGNVWDRLRAAYFLFRYPKEFIDGIIQEFISRVAAHTEETIAKMKAERAAVGESVPAELTADLTVAAAVAAQESMHG